MKRIISKVLIIFTIIVILFEFTGSSNISYAFDSEDISAITNLIGGIVSFILWIPRILVVGMAWLAGEIMTINLAESCGISDIPAFAGTEHECATPFDIFFNKYKLFDVNFFDITTEDNIINNIRTQVAQWFYTFRTIAAAILLVVLIYVGIRMAISTIAEEKAKYKKMLFDWCCSLALIFVLQYIAIFTIYANNAIVNFLREYGYNEIDQAINDIMDLAMGPMGIGSLVATFVYCMIIFQTIAFMLTYIQRMLKVGFLLIISPLISITYSIDKIGDGKAQALNTWLKEFVYTILIQPFHCIMYLAFVNTAMRLLGTGTITYSEGIKGIFNSLANGQFNQLTNGVLAILCLKFINDGEKAIRKIFNFQDDSSMTSMAAGAAVGMAALSNAKKIGSTTAKGINSVRSLPTKFGKAIGKDGAANGAFGKIGARLGEAGQSWKQASDAFQQTKIGGKLAEAGKFVGDKADKVGKAVGGAAKAAGNAIGNSKIGKGAVAFGNFANGKITNAAKFVGGKAQVYKARADEFRKNHSTLMKNISGAKTLGKAALKRSMPVALGMMGAAMSYATGTSGAMEAIGVGTGISHGSEEFFAASQGTVENDGAEAVEDMVDKDESVQEAKEALEESTSNLAETSENLSRTNQLIAGMSDTKKEMGRHYLDLYKQDDALEAKKASLDPSSATYAKDLEEIEKEREKIAKAQTELREDPEFAGVASMFDYKHQLERDLAEQTEARGELEANLKVAKNAAAKNVISSFKQNGSDSQIARARTEILKAVQKCQLEKKRKDAQGDASGDFQLNEDETSSAERMQKTICDLIDKTVLVSGADFDTSAFISQHFGNDSEMGKNLFAAVDEYQFQKTAQKYNQASDYGKSMGVDKDKYERDVTRKVSGLNG